ncbi:MAG: hypothetical protein ACRDV9_10730, partial [Acidimicrobiia bacterium]
LTIGMALEKAQSESLVTDVKPGCEAAGPGEKAAHIVAAEEGFATFNDGVLTRISLRKGLTAEGIGLGATVDELKQAYSANGYNATIDDSTLEVFGILLASVTKDGKEAYGFLVDPDTQTIEELSAPNVGFCD